MPVIQPDVSEMTDFEASVPNTYKAKITSVELKPSKEKQTPGVSIGFDFRAPRKADNEERDINRRSWLAIAGKGTFSWDQLLRCTGFSDTADSMKANPGRVPFDTDALIGKYVTVVVTTGEYQGKLNDNIQSFLPAD